MMAANFGEVAKCAVTITIPISSSPLRKRLKASTEAFDYNKGGRLSMNQRDAKRMLLAPAIAAIVMLLDEPLRAEVLEHTAKVAGTTVQYKIVLPDGYDPTKAY